MFLMQLVEIIFGGIDSFLMLLSRYIPMIAFLLLAENMSSKKKTATSEGILSTVSPTFVSMLVIVILVIEALIFAIGIAGMSRLTKENVIAMSGRAIEAAGDVDILLLDKTGTTTLGN